MNENRISIIVPVYNVDDYLAHCIDSLLAQTYEHIEIILVDDGSTDDSGDICDAYARCDERIKVIHKENAGVSAARNTGIRAASGEFLGFVDADDYVAPNMYEYLIDLIDTYHADIAQCRYIRTAENNVGSVARAVPSEDAVVLERKDALCELLCSQRVRNNIWSKLYRRDLFEGLTLDSRLKAGEDGMINYYLISRAGQVVLGSAPCYYYYQRMDSCTTGKLDEKIYQAIQIIAETANREKDPQIFKCWKFQLALIAINYLRRSIVEGDNRHFAELREYVLDARFALLQPKKYYELHDKWIHIHILLLWIAPSLYKKIILRNQDTRMQSS